MKTSLSLMRQYSGDEQWQLSVADLSAKIGEQLGAVEETINLAGKYDGTIVADVTEVKVHPNADKLNIYQIFDGKNTVQVVSGDRFINVGDKVGWIMPGATVPSTWGSDQPFVLGVRDMRGETSNGMFGSGKELDINDDHERVQVLDTDAPAGTPFAEAYGFANDAIIDIENKMFTHRPDCFGNLGVAREIAGIQGLPFTSPEWYQADAPLPQPQGEQLPLTVINKIPKSVPRYMAVVLDDVKIAPSPLWLQATLHKLGVRPINNVVDATNYIMLLTAQPLHAFDYNKVDDAHIIVRHPHPGEVMPLLDGRTIEPHKDAMLICDAQKPIGLGGMMGGGNSEIDAHTTRVVLECATFDMYTIRRTSMHNGVFTDAVTRYSKGQSPLQCAPVIAKAVELILQIAGGRVASQTVDEFAGDLQHQPIMLTSDFINSRLGSSLTAEALATTLRNVECAVEEHGAELLVTPPFWRTDLEIPEDIVEEIGRLNGYDTLPHSLPSRETRAVETIAIDELKHEIRNILASAGANELQTYSFVPARLLQQVGQEPKRAFAIRNALSPDLQHYRLSLTPSLLDKVHGNCKAGYKQFGLFEINKIHLKSEEALDCEGLPREYQTVAFVFASESDLPGAAFYRAKHYLHYLLSELGVEYSVAPAMQAPKFEVGRQVYAPFEPKRTGYVHTGPDGDFTGFVGEYRAAVSKNLKLPATCAGFEIDVERLLQHRHSRRYQQILKFPATEQDVCFKVASTVQYAEVQSAAQQSFAADERLRVTIAPLDIYQRQDSADYKQVTLRITLQHSDRTLTTAEVNDMLDSMVQKVAAVIPGAERI